MKVFNPIIITCAITGHYVTREIAPVPYTPQEQYISAKEAVENGASIIHLHIRGDNGEECLCEERYFETIAKLKTIEPTPIIEITPRGTDKTAMLKQKVERGNLVDITPQMWGNSDILKPELCALNISTRNVYEDTILINPMSDVKVQANHIYDLGLRPRVDVYDIGDIRTALGLLEKGFLKYPLHFLLILGSYSGIGASLDDLKFMIKQLPEGSNWTALGTGSKYNSFIAEQSIILGGNIRTGFEDETYIDKGIKAKSNAELVSKFVKICNRYERSVATPEQTRKILGLL